MFIRQPHWIWGIEGNWVIAIVYHHIHETSAWLLKGKFPQTTMWIG